MKRLILAAAALGLMLSLLLSICLGCGGQAASNNEGQDLSQIELPPKGNPKLDSQLNQLVSAQSRGEAALSTTTLVILTRYFKYGPIIMMFTTLTRGITRGMPRLHGMKPTQLSRYPFADSIMD